MPTNQAIEPVVARLANIYAAVVADREQLRRMNDPQSETSYQVLDLASLGGPPSPDRIDRVFDRESGLEYSAWCIGEALAAIGGIELMQCAANAFEQRFGDLAMSWLDHRWDGIAINGRVVWVA